MRVLCSSTLIGEFFVIGFAGLVAMQTSDLSTGTVWAVSGGAMLLCLLLCGLVSRPGGVQLGWALQVGLIASGFIVPMMFFLGVIFAGLWWTAVHFGREVERVKAARAAAEEAGEDTERGTGPGAAAGAEPDAV